MRVTFIYVLEDEHGFVRYVGKTVNPRTRYNAHISARRGRSPCAQWIAEMLASGRRPMMRTVAAVLGDTWMAAEQEWIRFFRQIGAHLLNVGDGGEDNPPVTPETRQRLSEALTGRRFTSEHCQRIGAANRQRERSLATRERMREASLGRKQSAESIEKRRAALKGMKKPKGFGAKVAERNRNTTYTPERMANLHKTRRGSLASEETRLKMSKAHRGRQKSPEHVAKVAAANRGRKNTPEQIERLKQAWVVRKSKSITASASPQ